MMSDVKDLKLASSGKLKIEWAGSQMKVLEKIKLRFKKEKPLKNITLAACLHVTAETANLVITLKIGGAKVALCASNPLSTQDEVAASLVKDFDIPTFAIKGEDTKTYYNHLNKVLDFNPQITMDDGADLVSLLHSERKNQLKYVIGSSEETTTGVIRLKAMEKDGALNLPVIAVNDSLTKHMFDNRYGTGQSTIDGILRATNVLLAGKKFLICGYGWCGRGLAARAKGMGAQVIIAEVNPVRALEAAMDGFEVMRIADAIKLADIIVTATGNKHVISKNHFNSLKNGVILANAGHFNVEFDYNGLIKEAKTKRTLRNYLEEVTLSSGKKVFVLGEGRLINLISAEGHPPDVMDMSFANQALAAEYLAKNKQSFSASKQSFSASKQSFSASKQSFSASKLKPGVHQLPDEFDKEIALIKLNTLGIEIDKLTKEQQKYLNSWQEGT
ncbi:adenosylhomocysteinase [Candidatus Daviesbacteria bacterium]|nr:adenosylhomocysteinase [Candidatus Daviesbacteria bacterium]